jgi:RING finger protein 113A
MEPTEIADAVPPADAASSTPTDSPAAPAAPVAIFKKRGAKGKINLRKRAATPPPAPSDSDDDDDDDDGSEYSSQDEAGHRVKRRRKNKTVAAGLVSASTRDAAGARPAADLGATVFSADRAVPITSSNDATKQSNWYDEGQGNEVVRSAKSRQPAKISDAAAGDGNYRGLANKTTFIQKNPDAPQSKFAAVGPIKAPTNIRTITVTDYAPDVCKDYKKTGLDPECMVHCCYSRDECHEAAEDIEEHVSSTK